MSTSNVHAASAANDAPAPPRWPPVTVVVLNYNGWRFLPTCLDALAATEYPQDALHVLVVDNASADGSVERLHQQYPWVRTLALPCNEDLPAAITPVSVHRLRRMWCCLTTTPPLILAGLSRWCVLLKPIRQ